MSSEVYKKFRHQSLMSDFDSLLSEMDGDLDATEEVEYFTSLSDLPPPDELEELSPQDELEELSPQDKWNEEDDLPPLYEGDEVQQRCEEEMSTLDSHGESLTSNKFQASPPGEEGALSFLDGQDDTDFPPPFSEEDTTLDATKYSKNAPNDPLFDLSASHNKIRKLEQCKTDSLDFTDADNAIDRMLDDLQDFSIQLTQSIPERSDKDNLQIIPEHSTKVTHNFNLENLELSAKDLEEKTDVDLDALLDDLCNMEMEFATKNNQVKSETGENKTELNPISEADPESNPTLSGPLADAIRDRLNSFRLEIKKSKELTEEEKEAKIKSEKIRIALEKMKAASVQKVFVRVFNNEKKTNKTFMIDSSWTARDVTHKMIAKDDVEANYNWCIMERIPNLFMERILEDSEGILQTVLAWPRDSNNALVFLNRRDKYMLFRNPQNFLLSSEHSNEDAKLAEKSKDILLREYFIKDNTQIPPLESILWLQDRPRKWVKHYCVLRASGIYYNAKGKNKVRNLSCLTPFENNVVYLGVGFKKVFKAPTDYVFCLKHPKIQAVKSKGIYTLCAEDAKTKEKWVMFIRMAKHGYQMYEDYTQTQEELEDIFLNAPQTDKSINDGTSLVKNDGTLKRKGTSLKRQESCVKATPTGTMNRIDGKRNALGLKFSMAWKQGLIVKAELAALANAQRKLQTQSEFSGTESKSKNAITANSDSPLAEVINEDQENQSQTKMDIAQIQSKEDKDVAQNKALMKDEMNENVVRLKPLNTIVKELSNDSNKETNDIGDGVRLTDSERLNTIEPKEDDLACAREKQSEENANTGNSDDTKSIVGATEDTNDLSVDDLLESLSNNLGNSEELYSIPNKAQVKKEEDTYKKDTLDIPQKKMTNDDNNDSLSNFTITPLSSSSSSLDSLENDEEFSSSKVQSSVPKSVDDLLAELSCDLSEDEKHESMNTEPTDFPIPEYSSDQSSGDETSTLQDSTDSTTCDYSDGETLTPEEETKWPDPAFLGENSFSEKGKATVEPSDNKNQETIAAEETKWPNPAFLVENSSSKKEKATMESSDDKTQGMITVEIETEWPDPEFLDIDSSTDERKATIEPSDDESLTSQVSTDSTTSEEIQSGDVITVEQSGDSSNVESPEITDEEETKWPEPIFIGENLSTYEEKAVTGPAVGENYGITAAEETEWSEPAFLSEHLSLHEGKLSMDTSTDFTDSEEAQSVSVNEFLAELCNHSNNQKKVLRILDLSTNDIHSSDTVEKSLKVANQSLTNVSSNKNETEVTVLEADKKVPHFFHLVATLKTSNGLTTDNLMREVASNLVKKWVEESSKKIENIIKENKAIQIG